MSSLTVAPNSPRQTAASVSAPTVPTQVIVHGGDESESASSTTPTSTEQIIEKISNLQDLENKK